MKKSKSGLKEEKKQQKLDVRQWRSDNVGLAIARDNGLCTVCWFVLGVKRKHTQVHHIYSRDRRSGGWREHYTNMLCVCNNHHPQPIITPGANESLAWVEAVSFLSNRHPINSRFVHEYESVTPNYTEKGFDLSKVRDSVAAMFGVRPHEEPTGIHGDSSKDSDV